MLHVINLINRFEQSTYQSFSKNNFLYSQFRHDWGPSPAPRSPFRIRTIATSATPLALHVHPIGRTRQGGEVYSSGGWGGGVNVRSKSSGRARHAIHIPIGGWYSERFCESCFIPETNLAFFDKFWCNCHSSGWVVGWNLFWGQRISVSRCERTLHKRAHIKGLGGNKNEKKRIKVWC